MTHPPDPTDAATPSGPAEPGDTAGTSAAATSTPGDHGRSLRSELLTWPNLVTALRLVAIPVFVWLLFARENRAAAAWLLGALGSTDWVDGWLARRFDQTTELGAIFDPVVDRLLFFVAIPSLLVDSSIPLVVAVALLAREGAVAAMAVSVKAVGRARLVVTGEGKTGAFLMMFALPLFLGHRSTLSYAPALIWPAWLFAVPGLAYGWYSALFQYLPVTRGAIGRRA